MLPLAATCASAFQPPADQELSGPPRFGIALVTGDFDGDGYDDLGVQWEDGYLYTSWDIHRGSAAGLDPVPALTLPSAQSFWSFSSSRLYAVLDANGDGLDDFAVSNPGGTLDLWSGDPGALPLVPSGWTTSAVLVEPRADGGDVNGDGYDDLVYADYNPFYYFANVKVYFGGPAGLSAAMDQHLSSPGPRVTVADVDGDGYADAALGNPFDYSGGSLRFRRGSPTGLEANLSWRVENNLNALYPALGEWMSRAGDLNGDGCEDLVTNTPTNRADPVTGEPIQNGVIVYGSPTGPRTLTLQTLITTHPAFAVSPDVDADGRDELLVGDGGVRVAGVPAGAAVRLRAGFVPPRRPEDRWLGAPDDEAGAAVAAGDFDGDGTVDTAIGAPGWNGDQGKVGVFYGP